MKSFILIIIFASGLQLSIAQNHDFPAQNQYLEKSRQTTSGLYSHRLDSNYTYIFNSEIDSSLLYKSTRSYNQDGNMVLSISYKENTPSQKREIIYEEKVTTSTFYIFSVEENGWVKKDKQIEVYDDQKFLMSDTDLEWINEEWQNKKKFANEYNDNGQLIQQVYFRWDGPTEEWIIHSKAEIIYDNQGREVLKISYYFDEGEYRHSYKTEYLYSQLETIKSDFIWENEWMRNNKTVETRSENGEWKEVAGYSFNNKTNKWDSASLYTYSYYPDGRQNKMTHLNFNTETKEIRFSVSYQDFYQPDIEPPVLRHHFADDLKTVDRKTYYYYTTTVTGIEQHLAKNNIYVTPNPATNEITIYTESQLNLLDLQITDIRGNFLFSKSVPVNQPVNIQSLPAGLLFYKISKNGDLIGSGKLIKN